MTIQKKTYAKAAQIIGGVLIITLICFSLFEREPDDSQKREIFNKLLLDWGLDLPGTYSISHYTKRTIHDEWGCEWCFFKLEISTNLANEWVANSKLFDGRWRKVSSLSPIQPPIKWWKDDFGTETECFYGNLQDRYTRQYIRFKVIIKTNGAAVFIESLGDSKRKERSLNR